MNKALEFYGEELDYIVDPVIRNFTEYSLNKIPNYHFLIPASSTGKYHPQQSLGEMGLTRHTRAVVYFARAFSRSYQLTEKETDIVISACLLHDSCKLGLHMQKYTHKLHDKIAADFILELGRSYEIPMSDLMQICTAIAFHAGPWTEHPKKKQFPDDYSKIETVVHISDMASAQRAVSLDFLEQNLIG